MSLERNDEIELLLEASSLGTPEARTLRDAVSREQAAAVLRRVEELEQLVRARGDVSTHDAFRRLANTFSSSATASTEEI